MERCSQVSKRKQLLLKAIRKRKERSRIKKHQCTSSRGQVMEFPNEETVVLKFREWCTAASITLNDKIYIGRHGSCHGIGVIARDVIRKGEIISVIPRSALLSADNSYLSHHINSDIDTNNSWIPLLIALIGEYTLKDKSYWRPYLSIVPNNPTIAPPPLLWSREERERLLGHGTGLYQLVENDLERIKNDYERIIKPFLQLHVHDSDCTQQSLIEAASFVMSYSFTDEFNKSLLSQTVMVPFVDLLNHSTNHHAELKFGKNALKLVAIRTIKSGEEIMNTFGILPNYSLLHTHGFIELSNPVDKACIPLRYLKESYFTSDTKWRRQRWSELAKNDIFDDVYEISSHGVPDKDLLRVIKLLTVKDMSTVTDVRFSKLTIKEIQLLTKYIEKCIANIPVIISEQCTLTEHYITTLYKQHKEYLNNSLQLLLSKP